MRLILNCRLKLSVERVASVVCACASVIVLMAVNHSDLDDTLIATRGIANVAGYSLIFVCIFL